MDDIRLCTYNVRGLRDSKKRDKIFKYLLQGNHNIILMQETHSSNEIEKLWRSQWGGDIYYSHGSNSSRGVAILVKRECKAKLMNITSDQQGRFIYAQFQVDNKLFNVANIYGPNDDCPEFYADIFNKILTFENIYEGDFRIIAGDMNLVMNLDLDKQGGAYTTNQKASQVVKQFLLDEHMIDIWRQNNPSKLSYTWKRQNIKVRLDYIFVSNTLQNSVSKVQINHPYKSDHSVPWIQFNMSGFQRGPGLWRLNVSLLKNPELVQKVTETINKIRYQDTNIHTKWNYMKYEAKKVIKDFSKQQNLLRKNKLAVLERKIQTNLDMIESIEQGARTLFTKEDCLKQIDLLEKDREAEIEYKVAGAKIRSRANWMHMGEKNTKYFLNLEKRNYKNKNIFALADPQNPEQLITSNKEILEMQEKYYAKLFTADKSEEQISTAFSAFTQSLEIPKISKQQHDNFEEPINLPEVKAAVFRLAKGKVPGNDGLPIEFYQKFWMQIRFMLLELCNDIAKNRLQGSEAQVVISLLDKGKDSKFLDNWRPISLLNCDTKIYSKIIASRIEDVIQELVHPDQSGIIRNRLIHENILDLMSILDYTQEKQIPALIISFDFRKAFDMVHPKCLDLTLELFGFGPKFRSMVSNIHKDTEFCTINCGFTSSYSKITRGLRQGNPASSYLFDLVVEILAQRIRQENSIQGIRMPLTGCHKKLSQYADDLWTCILATQENLTATLKVFSDFQMTSGLTINYNKTQILRIGSIRNSNAKFYSQFPLQWSTNIKVLGTEIYTTKKETVQKNYEMILNRMKQVLTPWKARNLTLIGRIQVINSLVASQYVYKIMTVASPSEKIIKQVKTIITDFLWNGKRPKIAYNMLIKSYSDGGLQLVDFYNKNLAIKSKWVKISFSTTHIWKEISSFLIGLNVSLAFEANVHYKQIPYKNKDWNCIDIWKAWAKIHYHIPLTSASIMSQQLWYNSHIKLNNQNFHWNNFSEKGVHRITNIYNQDLRRFYTYQEFAQAYKIHNFIQYNVLLKAIPKEWKMQLNKTNDFEQVEFNPMQIILEKTKITRELYWLLINRIPHEDKALSKWNHRFNNDINNDQWQKIRIDTFKISIETKLRYFQYRLISDKLTTNLLRAKWDPQVSPLCYYCQKYDETVLHLLWECSIVQKFWRSLLKWMEYVTKEVIIVDAQIIVFNNVESTNSWLINTIILKAKQYIYATKCLRQKLDFMYFTRQIFLLYLAEKSIANTKSRITMHIKKWKMYINYIE